MASREQEHKALTVNKKSGRTEPFNQEKMVRGIARAGVPFAMAMDIGKSITNRISNKGASNINSSELKKLVVEELKDRNEKTIAESYLGYSKNNVTGIKEEFAGSDKYNSKVQPTVETHQKEYVKNKDNTAGEEHKLGLS